MKSNNDSTRKLAKLYGIEVIEAPNIHQYVKENGDVISFNDPRFWDAFNISFSDSLYYDDESNVPFLEETTGFLAKNVAVACFKTDEQFSNDVTNSENYQYAMAA